MVMFTRVNESWWNCMSSVEYDISHYWKTVLDTVRDAIMVISPEGRILTVNKAAEEVTGYRAGELVGNLCTMLNCTGCELYAKGSGHEWCRLFNDGLVNAKRCEITGKGGRTVHVIKRAQVLHDAQGRLMGAVEALSDVSEVVRQEREIVSLRQSMNAEEGFHGILGNSPQMHRIFELIQYVADSEAPVLISGESGTGKELIAQAIHDMGPRSQGPFIKVNCATLNENVLESELFGHVRGAFTGADRNREGRFQAAHGGDLFLDEFGDVPLSTQVKLLRVLEDKVIERVGDHTPIQVDVRIITASNRDLKQLIAQGLFREDLFYRVNVVPIWVPPLRDRKEDIALLARHFVDHLSLKTGKLLEGFTPRAMDRLYAYGWPGNVRELKNAVDYAFVICRQGLIDIGHLPEHLRQGNGPAPPPAPEMVSAPPPPATPGQDPERRQLIEALRQSGGNQTQAARLLGVSRMTVWKRMKKYDINITRDVG